MSRKGITKFAGRPGKYPSYKAGWDGCRMSGDSRKSRMVKGVDRVVNATASNNSSERYQGKPSKCTSGFTGKRPSPAIPIASVYVSDWPGCSVRGPHRIARNRVLLLSGCPS
jgi:hypothetical protein